MLLREKMKTLNGSFRILEKCGLCENSYSRIIYLIKNINFIAGKQLIAIPSFEEVKLFRYDPNFHLNYIPLRDKWIANFGYCTIDFTPKGDVRLGCKTYEEYCHKIDETNEIILEYSLELPFMDRMSLDDFFDLSIE